MANGLLTRHDGPVRSQVFFAMRHLAQEHGIAVVEVPARGTSSGCPRCGRDLLHVKSSDNQASGYHWAHCRHCGLSCDRDLSAAWRIGARGLASQARAHWRKDGPSAISKSSFADAPVSLAKRRSRDKRHATINSTPAPRRRRLPSSTGSQGLAEQRPEGQVPKAGSQALCESSASSTERTVRHRPRGEPRGEPLGRGFHRNVYASPVRPYGDWGPGRQGTPSLRIA
ncbi:MAG: zinc ribbon domain-containing protein [Candidatus Dormibacteria bacterium]